MGSLNWWSFALKISSKKTWVPFNVSCVLFFSHCKSLVYACDLDILIAKTRKHTLLAVVEKGILTVFELVEIVTGRRLFIQFL